MLSVAYGAEAGGVEGAGGGLSEGVEAGGVEGAGGGLSEGAEAGGVEVAGGELSEGAGVVCPMDRLPSTLKAIMPTAATTTTPTSASTALNSGFERFSGL